MDTVNFINNINVKKFNLLKNNPQLINLKKSKLLNNNFEKLYNLNIKIKKKNLRKVNIKSLYFNLNLKLLKKIFFNNFKLILINNLNLSNLNKNKIKNLKLIKNKLISSTNLEISSTGSLVFAKINLLNELNEFNLNENFEINSIKINNKIFYKIKLIKLKKKVYNLINFSKLTNNFLKFNKLLNFNIFNFINLLNYKINSNKNKSNLINFKNYYSTKNNKIKKIIIKIFNFIKNNFITLVKILIFVVFFFNLKKITPYIVKFLKKTNLIKIFRDKFFKFFKNLNLSSILVQKNNILQSEKQFTNSNNKQNISFEFKSNLNLNDLNKDYSENMASLNKIKNSFENYNKIKLTSKECSDLISIIDKTSLTIVIAFTDLNNVKQHTCFEKHHNYVEEKFLELTGDYNLNDQFCNFDNLIQNATYIRKQTQNEALEILKKHNEEDFANFFINNEGLEKSLKNYQNKFELFKLIYLSKRNEDLLAKYIEEFDEIYKICFDNFLAIKKIFYKYQFFVLDLEENILQIEKALNNNDFSQNKNNYEKLLEFFKNKELFETLHNSKLKKQSYYENLKEYYNSSIYNKIKDSIKNIFNTIFNFIFKKEDKKTTNGNFDVISNKQLFYNNKLEYEKIKNITNDTLLDLKKTNIHFKEKLEKNEDFFISEFYPFLKTFNKDVLPKYTQYFFNDLINNESKKINPKIHELLPRVDIIITLRMKLDEDYAKIKYYLSEVRKEIK